MYVVFPQLATAAQFSSVQSILDSVWSNGSMILEDDDTPQRIWLFFPPIYPYTSSICIHKLNESICSTIFFLISSPMLISTLICLTFVRTCVLRIPVLVFQVPLQIYLSRGFVFVASARDGHVSFNILLCFLYFLAVYLHNVVVRSVCVAASHRLSRISKYAMAKCVHFMVMGAMPMLMWQDNVFDWCIARAVCSACAELFQPLSISEDAWGIRIKPGLQFSWQPILWSRFFLLLLSYLVFCLLHFTMYGSAVCIMWTWDMSIHIFVHGIHTSSHF